MRSVDQKPDKNSPQIFSELSLYTQVIFKMMGVTDDSF